MRNPNPVDSSRCINPLDSSCSAELVENPVMTHALSTLVGRVELELRLKNRAFSKVKIPIFLHAAPGPRSTLPLGRNFSLWGCCPPDPPRGRRQGPRQRCHARVQCVGFRSAWVAVTGFWALDFDWIPVGVVIQWIPVPGHWISHLKVVSTKSCVPNGCFYILI